MKQMKEENKRQIFVLVYYYLFQYNNEVKYNKKSRRIKKTKVFFFFSNKYKVLEKEYKMKRKTMINANVV
jgi:hypothetical protein